MSSEIDDREAFDPFERDDRTWSIAASSGRGSIVFRIEGAPTRSWLADTVVCSVRVRQSSWQRGRDGLGRALVKDVDIKLFQVVIDAGSLARKQRELADWLDNHQTLTIDMSSSEHQDQSLEFSINVDRSNVLETWTCSLVYECGTSMVGRWSFVVDQSCVRLCAEALGEVLDALGTRR